MTRCCLSVWSFQTVTQLWKIWNWLCQVPESIRVTLSNNPIWINHAVAKWEFHAASPYLGCKSRLERESLWFASGRGVDTPYQTPTSGTAKFCTCGCGDQRSGHLEHDFSFQIVTGSHPMTWRLEVINCPAQHFWLENSHGSDPKKDLLFGFIEYM